MDPSTTFDKRAKSDQGARSDLSSITDRNVNYDLRTTSHLM